MMEPTGNSNPLLQRLTSKTYLLAIVTLVIGAIQANPAMLGDTFHLSNATLGWVMVGVGVAAMVIREVTSLPLSEK